MVRRGPAVLLLVALVASCRGGDAEPTAATSAQPVASTTPPAVADDPEPEAPQPSVTASPTSASPSTPTTTPNTTPTTTPTTVPPDAELPGGVDIFPGTEQVTVVGVAPGQLVELYADDGAEVASAVADGNGTVLFRHVGGGTAVTIGWPDVRSAPVEVMPRDQHPDESFYDAQSLRTDGAAGAFGYLTTRDGTTLSATTWLPGPEREGPYPTVVEYSGYSPSDPESQGFPQLLNALGYAYVGVNMRGTGCSGGSYRFFEYVQSLDGYDAVEVVAAQPWALDGRVGMVGISYPGISQLFVAQTNPPSLAAITPLSVLADSYRSTLYPGGILNTGFAVSWTERRVEEARPAGQAWAAERIAEGDATCAANQQLRLQNPDLTAEIGDHPYWADAVAAEIAPRLFVDRIDVPVFVAGAWQDEQTGGHFATMLDRFTGTEHVYATLYNGLHSDAIGPAVLPRLVEFLDLYVAERVPSLDAARTVVPLLAGSVFGTTAVSLPDVDRFAGMEHSAALAAFESEPPIEVLFESGAAPGAPAQAPMAAFRAQFGAWPVPQAAATRWFLSGSGEPGTAGGLVADAAGRTDAAGTDYLALPEATPSTFFSGGGDSIWSVDATYDWQQGAPGTYAGFVTEPLPADTAVVGSGSVDLWITAGDVGGDPRPDTDLEVTVSEVTPRGDEVYVQSGWLRASHRALDQIASDELHPVHTHLEADAADLPAGEPEPVRVELFPFAHVFRAGSRLRLTIDAPGGNRATWEFATIAGGERVTVAHDADHPSSIVLPIVDLAAAGVTVPAERPTCGALRGQPCRTYTP